MSGKELAGWQARMAPLMVAFVVVSGVFFGVISVVEFGKVQGQLARRPTDLSLLLADLPVRAEMSSTERLQLVRAKASIVLEGEALARRYDQAQAIVVSKLWTRFMGFTTGMILALVGAAFVLGRLQEPASSLQASGAGASLAFTSASPGLVLAVLGSTLMALAITSTFDIETRDAPTYFKTEEGVDPADNAPADVDHIVTPSPRTAGAPTDADEAAANLPDAPP